MAVPGPPWKVKSRPCPFYSQGRCLFADSCNFLHQVKVHSNLDESAVSSSRSTDSFVSVDQQTNSSPTSLGSPEQSATRNRRSIRSPTRSPRLSQLLLALQDVIGVEEEEEEELVSEEDNPITGLTLTNEPNNLTSREPDDPWTFVGNSGSISPVTVESLDEEKTAVDPLSDGFEHQIPTVRLNRSFEAGGFAIVSSPTTYDSLSGSLPPKSVKASLDLLSPIDVSNLPLIPFPRDESAKRDDSIDSGYADSWTTLQPMRLSPPRSPTRLSSTFDLLSSPFGSPSSRILSPRLGPFMGRSPATEFLPPPSHHGPFLSAAHVEAYTPTQPDSGYHTGIQSALGDVDDLSLSDPMEEETIKLVGMPNPFGQQTSPIRSPISGSSEFEDDRVLSESTFPDGCLTLPTKDFPDVHLDPVVNAKANHTHIDSGTSNAEQYIGAEGHPTVVDTLPRMSFIQDSDAIPVPDDGVNPSYVDNASASNIVSSLDKPPNTQPPIPNAGPSQAAESRSAILHGDDALDTVHGNQHSYSSPLGETDPAVERVASFNIGTSSPSYEPSHHGPHSSTHTRGRAFTPPLGRGRMDPIFGTPTSPLSRSCSPAGLNSPFHQSSPDQGRVFSPPPGRWHAGTSRGTSSHSSSVSPAGLDSPFQGNSPHSWSAKAKGKQSAQSPARENDGPENLKSTKVPFGFRKPAALGKARTRTSRSIPPPLTRLRIITDPPKQNSAPATEPPLSAQAYKFHQSPSPATAGLKPLRLSAVLSANHHALSSPPPSESSVNNQSGYINRASMSSTSVSSDFSLSHNKLLSSARSSLIPEHIRHTLVPALNMSLSPRSLDRHENFPPQSAPVSHSHSWNTPLRHSIGSRNQPRLDSHSLFANRRVESVPDDERDKNGNDAEGDDSRYDHTVRLSIPLTAPIRPVPSMYSPSHAIATPRPALLFAIASDDPAQVRKVLESGDVGPNDQVGPQSALAFTIMNTKLTHKVEMVKTLLAFGADPAVIKDTDLKRSPRRLALSDDGSTTSPGLPSIFEGIDSATRYYVDKASASRKTSALIYRSFFRPLTRVRYDMVGQDRVLEQLFRVLSIHSQQLSVTPIVVLLCGPSGHGKSLLARKFGSHLDVPTHTVNMTTLRSTHELWQSYSMSPYEEPSNCTLAEFLINNEGRRCVVVLDEIEKTADERTLWSLLMPWELGRCSLEAGTRHIDVRNVVWLGTSNVGHKLIFEHHATRRSPDELMSREEYLALTALLRPVVSECLGASLLSRVTTVLPFVPFSPEEKKAIVAEALYALGGDLVTNESPSAVEAMVLRAVSGYVPAEGARSLYRAVSSQLIDAN